MKRPTWLILAALFAALPPAAHAAGNLPINPAVNESTIDQTVCVIGWTKTVRPPYAWSNAIKIEKLREVGLTEAGKSRFELDHRIPLCLGGAPADRANLQLQPWDDAEEKDRIESCLCRAVCAGRVELNQARRAIWTDWRAAEKLCG